MDRELVLGVLVLLVAGPAILAAGAWPTSAPREEACARSLERWLWLRLLAPLVPALLVLSALLGWALVEPEQAEAVPPAILALALPLAGVWLRGIARSVRAIRISRVEGVPAGTHALLKPRAFLSPELTGALDPEACHAALEHEQAHVRHRDPLRIWVAQLVTDLQWPLPAPRRRFEAWLEALELARDEEARLHGADGPALASAIVAALRLAAPVGRAASLTGTGTALRERVARLLSPLPLDRGVGNRRALLLVLVVGGASGAFCFGLAFGEGVVGALLR